MNNNTGNKKIPIDIRRRLYQAIVVNIALGSERALKEADRSKLEAFHHECLRKMRADDVGCRETDHE
jgi:hypothetical protein